MTTLTDAVTSAAGDLNVKEGKLRSTLDGLLASATAARVLLAPPGCDPTVAADELDGAAPLAGPWTTPRVTCPGRSPALSAGSMSWRKRDGSWATTASSR